MNIQSPEISVKTIPILLTLVCCLMLTACKSAFDNQPPLIRAIAQNKFNTVKTLLTQGAKVDQTLANGTSAIMVAAAVGNDHIVQLLLLYHPKLNTRNEDGSTALLAAAAAGNSDVAKLLIKHGANPCQKSNNGLLAYQTALKWGNPESAHKLEHTCKDHVGERA